MTLIFHNGPIFDGACLRHDHFAAFDDARLTGLGPDAEMPTEGERIDLGGDILSPGMTDEVVERILEWVRERRL